MKRGVPPTARKARTGELTPPGMTRWARSNSAALLASGHGGWAPLVAASSASASASAAAASSPSSAGGIAQKKRSGTTLPMPGRKPASRLWSRKASASPTAACSSLPAASSEASAAASVSPAPTKAASKRSNFSPVSAPCGDASTLSMNCSLPLEASITPVTSTKRVPCSPAATASSRGEAGRSLSQSGSRKSVSVLWLPTSTSVAGRISSRKASR